MMPIIHFLLRTTTLPTSIRTTQAGVIAFSTENAMNLEERLMRLELQNRQLRRLVLLTGLFIAAPLVLAATALDSDVLRARRFELVDENGAVRGTWECVKQSGATINLDDGAGTGPNLVLRGDGHGGGSVYVKAKGTTVYSLTADGGLQKGLPK